MTLDIKDLYVNIPIKETMGITKNQLTIHNDERIANQIVQLLETILAKNYFTFQNQIYQHMVHILEVFIYNLMMTVEGRNMS